MSNSAPVIATTQFFSTATNGQVAENVGVGTSLFILIAYDPDGDTKGYALVDDYGLFSIDGNGIVSLTGALDYETTPSYVLRIAVSDGTDSVFEDITLTISDANEAPVFTQNHYFASVAENDATAAVETVSASIDAGETIAYSIIAGGSGVFAIDENSGAITLKRALDFENEPTQYTLTINAYDGHYHTTAQVTVNVTDVNDNAPVLTALQTTASLVEQTAAAPIDTGITFTASDVDTNTLFSESDFAVSDAVTGAVDPRFAIVAAGNHWKLQIKAGATLDYENPDDQSIALMVKVNDGIYSDEVEVTITVTDINDNAPTLTATQATASLAEQTAAAPTDTGITFTASDVDSNTSFSATDFAVSDDRFQVVADGNDGTNWKLQLKAGKTLNYEDASDRSIVLNVKVNDGIHDSADVAVTVNVTDANDAPVFNEYALQWFATFADNGNVAEDIAIDTPIAVIWAHDDDGNSLTYRLLDGASAHLFKINESTGIISVKAALDYETATSHTLTIEASDGSATTTTDITIDVVNINDTAPTLTANQNTASLTEQTAATAVDTGIILTPSDPDGLHTFSDADFTLSGDARFEIVAAGNNWKLQLKTGAILDHEDANDQSIVLNVKVNDGRYDSNDVAITITVVDVNDNAPVLSANQTTASLAEQTTTAAVDTGITFTVSDADASSTFSAASFAVSGDDRFEVVADGDDWKLQLKANKTLDYEDADDRSIVLNVKVNDGDHDSDEVAVTINVSDVNDNTPTLTANQATASLAEQTATSAVDTGITFTASDVDTNTSFAETDFTISGDDRFEIIADGNDGNYWKLQLKTGATLNYEDAIDRSIVLNVKVNDGIHDSADVAVTINVTDVNDNAPVLAAVQAAASLAEQTATTAVDTGITFIAYDADATNILSSANFTVSDDRFQIVADGNDGYYWKLQLKTGATLNYEDANDRSIVLNVNVNDGIHDSHAIAVTLNVSDANDAPVFDAYAPQWFGTFASGNVAEDTATNTPIAVIWASDEDGDSITYRLVPNASSHLFKIDENVGIISVKGTLDFEATTNHTLTIEASDSKGGTTTTDVTINVVDVNEFTPVLTANQATASLAEQVATTAVDTGITFTARDADASSTFSAANFAVSGDNRFEVVADGDDWKLQLKEGMSLNYENANDRSIALTVKVNDGDHDSNNVAVTINVLYVNEFAPVIMMLSSEIGSVKEGAVNLDTEIIFSVSDEDGTTFASSDFEVLDKVSGISSSKFTVMAVLDSDGNAILDSHGNAIWKLKLKASEKVDYDVAITYDLTIKVNDYTKSTSADVAVNVERAIHGIEGYEQINGTTNAENIYSYGGGGVIRGNSGDDTIYGGTGDDLLYGGEDSDTLYGEAGRDELRGGAGDDILYGGTENDTLYGGSKDDGMDTLYGGGGSDFLRGGAGADIFVLNTYDSGADKIIDFNPTIGGAGEGDRIRIYVDNPTSISTIAALFNDAGLRVEKGQITVSGVSNYFDSTTDDNTGIYKGNVLVMVLEDFDDDLTVDMFHVVPINDVTIVETIAINSVIFEVVPTNVNADATLTYAITGGNGDNLFDIDDNGNITLVKVLDYETTTKHTLTVQITETDSVAGTSTTDTLEVVINVADVNEEAPVFSKDSYNVEIGDNAPIGIEVASALASDADAGDALTYSIIGGNDDGFFTIDTNGKIMIASTLENETNNAHELTVQVRDKIDHTDTLDITINVVTSEAPILNIDSYSKTFFEATTGNTEIVQFTATDADDDDDTLTYSIVGNDYGGRFTIDATTGSLSFSGSSTASSSVIYEVIVRVSDEKRSSDEATVTVIDPIRGTDNGESLYGTDLADFMYGGGGGDIFSAREGDDTLYGDAGDDILRGGGGDDTLYGGTGIDTLYGKGDNDKFHIDIANAVAGSINADIVADFSRSGVSGVDSLTIDGAENFAFLRVARNPGAYGDLIQGLADGTGAFKHNTVIYHNGGTTETTDDIVLMVLDDFNFADFDLDTMVEII